MSTHETISQLMTEVGPAADLLVVDEYAEEGLWHIAVDDRTEIIAEIDEDRAVLVLSASAERALMEERGAVYELALRYNHAWRASGGVRFSLDGEEGALWLTLELALAPLTSRRLAEEITAFVKKLMAWRQVVETFTLEANLHESLGFLSMPGFIRS